jgi:hypothetical protein
MRACTTANVIAVCIALAAATFAACSGSSTSQSSPTPTGGATDSQTGTPTESGGTDSPGATGSSEETAAPAPAPKKKPETVADCKELKTEIVNEPPASAVPMNNATAPGDGAASDRLQPMVDLIKSNRDKFRCCFDLWARTNPGIAGRVTIKVKLDQHGTLTSSEIVAKDTTIRAPEVHSCILEVTKSLTYPKSPSGKETTYTHPFDFKARN